jgi:hypothetical protein
VKGKTSSNKQRNLSFARSLSWSVLTNALYTNELVTKETKALRGLRAVKGEKIHICIGKR